MRENGISEEEIEKYHAHMDVSQEEKQQQIIDYMRSKKMPEKVVKRQEKLFGIKRQKDDKLVIKYHNRGVFHWLSEHPLIWSYGNDGDGVRVLLGMDYSKIQNIFDLEGLKESVFRQDLFYKLRQIEIGAKASFDNRLYKSRKAEERKRKSG